MFVFFWKVFLEVGSTGFHTVNLAMLVVNYCASS